MPVIDNDDLAKLLYVNEDGSTPGFRSSPSTGSSRSPGGRRALRRGYRRRAHWVSEAIAEGADVIVLSDRNSTAYAGPDPALLLVAAVHHHLVRDKTRTQVGLVIESGDAREVHHMALLKGFGAAAINPYLAFETSTTWSPGILDRGDVAPGPQNYIKAASKGIIKVMSKMGISTVAPTPGPRSSKPLVWPRRLREYFTGTVSRIGGVGLDVLADEVAPATGSPTRTDQPSWPTASREVGGEYQWRREGEIHLFNPKTVFKLQHATRSQALRGLQGVHQGGRRAGGPPGHLAGSYAPARPAGRPIPIDEVEPAAAILARFSTGPCPTARSRPRPTRPWPSP